MVRKRILETTIGRVLYAFAIVPMMLYLFASPEFYEPIGRYLRVVALASMLLMAFYGLFLNRQRAS